MRIFALILVLALLVGCTPDTPTGEAVAETPEPIADSCIDSDNGINKETRGTIIGIENEAAFEYQDKCIAGLLIEYYCENNKPSNQNLRCNCLDGACI